MYTVTLMKWYLNEIIEIIVLYRAVYLSCNFRPNHSYSRILCIYENRITRHTADNNNNETVTVTW